MKIEIARDVTLDVGGREVTLHDVFCGIGIPTDVGTFGIAQRDGGIEVRLNGRTILDAAEAVKRASKP